MNMKMSMVPSSNLEIPVFHPCNACTVCSAQFTFNWTSGPGSGKSRTAPEESELGIIHEWAVLRQDAKRP